MLLWSSGRAAYGYLSHSESQFNVGLRSHVSIHSVLGGFRCFLCREKKSCRSNSRLIGTYSKSARFPTDMQRKVLVHIVRYQHRELSLRKDAGESTENCSERTAATLASPISHPHWKGCLKKKLAPIWLSIRYN